LLSLYLPKEDYNVISNHLEDLLLPIRSVFSENGNAYSFFYQHVSGDDNNIGIILRESQMHVLYDVSQDRIAFEEVSFKEFFSFDISSCSNVSSYISDQSSCNEKKILNNLMIQEKYQECYPLKQPILTSADLYNIQSTPRSNGFCQRAELELDLIYPELNQNITDLGYFKLSSSGTFLIIDNQALPSSAFYFELDWIIGRDGEPWGEPRRLRLAVARNDLVDIKINVEFVGGVTIFGRRFFAKRKEVVSVTPKSIPLSVEVFSKVPQHRHWRLENQGDAFWINVMERKSMTSGSTSQQSETVSTTIGGNLGFSVPNYNVNAGLTFENKYTRSNTITITKTGLSVIDLGNTFFEYCEPYPNISLNHPFYERWRWLQDRTTGSVEIWLDSYWIP
jgi:hypothetical protein